MKNVLGLDLGTNSIGWAKVSMDDDGKFARHQVGKQNNPDESGYSGKV